MTEMSIQNISSAISSIDRDISGIERQLYEVDGTLNRKQKEINAISEKISREKDIKRMLSYQKDLSRKNDEINNMNRIRSSKVRALSEKRSKRSKLLQELSKEEQKERDKSMKEQKELLSIKLSIARENERLKQLEAIASPLRKSTSSEIEQNKTFDVFVSHASEDKTDFVRPFVDALKMKDVTVWYDEFELQVGDSLRRSIEQGLKNSKYGVVVLSEAFFKKEWPQRELDGLFSREVNGEKVILPIWHKISKNEVLTFSPIIADMVSINTTNNTIEEIAEVIAKRISGSGG